MNFGKTGQKKEGFLMRICEFVYMHMGPVTVQSITRFLNETIYNQESQPLPE
jgi:hypothetical protein